MSDRYRKSRWTDEEIALVVKEEVRLTATQSGKRDCRTPTGVPVANVRVYHVYAGIRETLPCDQCSRDNQGLNWVGTHGNAIPRPAAFLQPGVTFPGLKGRFFSVAGKSFIHGNATTDMNLIKITA